MKDIIDYEYLYSITNDGRVYSKVYGKFLKYAKNKKGYLWVCLYNNKKRKSYYISRLVAKHFLSNYSEKLTVNHKDLNKTNNYYKNLEMMTNKENMMHGIKHGVRHNYKLKINIKKLINDEIKKISKRKNIYGGFNKDKHIAKKFNIGQSTTNKILKGVYFG